MKTKGVIFDMDGVVVDNHSYHFKAWMEFARVHKFDLDENIYREKFNGKTNKDLFEMIFSNPTPDEIKKYSDEKESLYQEIYFPDMTPLKGLIDFLDFLQSKQIRIALGTSAPTQNVDFVLDHLKLRKYFGVIVDGSMVDQGKPHPQVYQLCALKLGLEPQHCVVFEDSLAGLESGERAGCRIIGVATSHEAYELKVKTEEIIFDFTEAKGILGL